MLNGRGGTEKKKNKKKQQKDSSVIRENGKGTTCVISQK